MTLEQRQVSFGRSIIDYRIERSDRRKTVTIAVDPGAGVVLKAPSDAPMRRLDDVVKTKAPWILQRLVEFREFGPGPSPKEFLAGESYSYLGRHYRLRIERAPNVTKPIAALHGALLTVYLPHGDLRDAPEVLVRCALVAWYRRQAYRRLRERVAIYAARVGLGVPHITVREQAKRWGSCTDKGVLHFNWRVIMAPLSLVDYVVAHEICHLSVRDHSKRFWRLLATTLPDFEIRRADLRIIGARLCL